MVSKDFILLAIGLNRIMVARSYATELLGEDGFDLHFAPEGAKLRCRCGPARIEQLSTGQLHLMGSNPHPNAEKDQSERIGLFLAVSN